MVHDMHSFLSEYSSTVVLAPPRHLVPCGTSRAVPGAHRIVDPGTHRGSGPREVHTTPEALPLTVVGSLLLGRRRQK
jgi:hypothetical protein